MRIFGRNLLAGLIGLFPLLSGAQVLTDEEAAQVIARVGDETITAGEFARDLQLRLAQTNSATGRTMEPDLRMRRLLMNELIQTRILSIAARNAGVEVSEAELQAEFVERKSLFDSEDAYKNYLNAMKLTEEELLGHMRSRIRIKHFIDQEVGEIAITDEAVSDAYALMKSQGQMTRTNDSRDIAVILLRAKGGDDAAWLAAEERAKAIKARIDGGDAFEDVAREVSEDPTTALEGGVLLEMKLGSFYPELEAAMDALEVGQVSDPVRSVMGWYILVVRQENKPGTIPLEKVAPKIKEELEELHRKEKIAGIVSEAQKIIRVDMVKALPGENESVPPAP